MMPLVGHSDRLDPDRDSAPKDDDLHAVPSHDTSSGCDGDSDVQSNVVDESISELEKKFSSIDISLPPFQASIEGICHKKQTFYAYSRTSSLWNHSCGIWGSAASCTSKDEQTIVDKRADVDKNPEASAVSRKTGIETRGQQPMDKLPVELWAQIFYLCLPSDDFITPDPRQAPLLLCQICTSWRNIATGTPLLWSALSIRGSWCIHIWKASLESWLRRAGNAFLYLDISLPLYMEPMFTYHIQKMIISTANRWHHLRLNLTNPLLCSMLKNPMPELRTLEFSSPYPLTSLNIHPSHVPSLKTVSLLTNSLYIQPLSLPWRQLTRLSSQCWLNIRQHLDILRKCPHLEFYSMRVVDAEMAYTLQPVLIHPLRSLEITPFMGCAIGPVLKHLQLPNITTLTFVVPDESPGYGRTTWPGVHVLSLIERSSCPLTHLTFRGLITSEEIITAIWNTIPSLTSIELR